MRKDMIGSDESVVIKKINQDKLSDDKDIKDTKKADSIGAITGKDEAPEEVEENPQVSTEAQEGVFTVDEPMLDALVESRAKQKASAYQKEVSDKLQNLAEELEAIQSEKDASDKEVEALQSKLATEKRKYQTMARMMQDPGADFGSYVDSDTSRNVYIASGRGVSPIDAVRESLRLFDSAPTFSGMNQLTASFVEYKNTEGLKHFYRNNRDSVLQGLDAYCKKHGLLRGQAALTYGKDAPTVPTDIPPLLLEVLAMESRQTHLESLVFWQFLKQTSVPGTMPGWAARIERTDFSETTTDVSDYLLTPGVSLTTETQPLDSTSVLVQIGEYGLGKVGTNLKPVAITDFVQSVTVQDLMQKVNRNLGVSYYRFEDLQAKTLMDSTTQVVYNSNSSVVSDPGDVAATEDGRMSYKFLNALGMYMYEAKVPKYRDGKYCIIMNPTALSQLRNDLYQNSVRIAMESNAEGVLSLLSENNDGLGGRVSGYIGTVADFHIFVTNDYGVGAVGSVGVQTETIGGGSNTTRSSIAFGLDPIGSAVAMPMSIYQSKNDDYGRVLSFVWRKHAGYAGLDIDPNRGAGDEYASEQIRVFKVRTSDAEL